MFVVNVAHDPAKDLPKSPFLMRFKRGDGEPGALCIVSAVSDAPDYRVMFVEREESTALPIAEGAASIVTSHEHLMNNYELVAGSVTLSNRYI